MNIVSLCFFCLVRAGSRFQDRVEFSLLQQSKYFSLHKNSRFSQECGLLRGLVPKTFPRSYILRIQASLLSLRWLSQVLAGQSIITTLTGDVAEKKRTIAVPISPQEQIESAHEAFDAGARVVHLHVRDEAGVPTWDAERYGMGVLSHF